MSRAWVSMWFVCVQDQWLRFTLFCWHLVLKYFLLFTQLFFNQMSNFGNLDMFQSCYHVGLAIVYQTSLRKFANYNPHIIITNASSMFAGGLEDRFPFVQQPQQQLLSILFSIVFKSCFHNLFSQMICFHAHRKSIRVQSFV